MLVGFVLLVARLGVVFCGVVVLCFVAVIMLPQLCVLCLAFGHFCSLPAWLCICPWCVRALCARVLLVCF